MVTAGGGRERGAPVPRSHPSWRTGPVKLNWQAHVVHEPASHMASWLTFLSTEAATRRCTQAARTAVQQSKPAARRCQTALGYRYEVADSVRGAIPVTASNVKNALSPGCWLSCGLTSANRRLSPAIPRHPLTAGAPPRALTGRPVRRLRDALPQRSAP